MIRSNAIPIIEFLGTNTHHPIEDICFTIRERLELPTFAFGQDERAEWGTTQLEGVEYILSALREPDEDDGPDDGFNVSIVLLVGQDCPHANEPDWSANVLVPRVAKAVAKAVGEVVVHQKTWLSNNTTPTQSRRFYPNRKDDGQVTRTETAPNSLAWVTTNEAYRPDYTGPLDFAFLVHPRGVEEKIRPFPEFQRLPLHLIERLTFLKPCTVIGGMQVERNGRTLHGELLTIPFAPHDMLERLTEAREAIDAVLAYTASRRTRILGLGALIPSITRQGQLLANKSGTVGITTGHAFTALSIANYVRKIEREFEIDGPVAIIGAAGSTGRAATRCLIRDNPKRPLILLDLPTRLGVIVDSHRLGPQHRVTADRNDIRKAAIVVCVTNAPGSILNADDFAPNCVILDDAQPENVRYEDLRSRPDLTVVKCLAHVRGLHAPFDFGLFPPGLHPEKQALTFTCLAETILLASVGHTGSFTVGDPKDAQLDYLHKHAVRQGIFIAPFHSFPQIGAIDLVRQTV